jgi:hypothetical protein|tara:strand:+ start:192 stop:866 length:675 start_codon:yes stop_codon:yes gene_type:complete
MDKRNFVSVRDNNLYQRGPNPNLRGLNTQFGDHFGIKNKIIENNKETFKKYDVIPDKGLVPKIINKPHKLVVSFNDGHVADPIILNEPFKDVVSVKLLNGIFIESGPPDTTTPLTIPIFITLSINELNNIYSTSTPSGNSLLNSFAILEYDKTFDRDISGNTHKVNIYKNKFGINQDIRYFDPPLNSLSQLNISLFDDESSTPAGTYKCKLEFIVETKDKLRVY